MKQKKVCASLHPTKRGDVNCDGYVGMFDITILGLAFGSKPSSSNWDARADLNDNSIVDVFDLVVVALALGDP